MGEAEAASAGGAPVPPAGSEANAGSAFNAKELNSARRPSKLLQRILNNPLWIFAVLRRVAPVFKLPFINWVIVTRFDHVEELLAQDQVFRVPWAEKMRAANDGGAIFLLGIDDPAQHRQFEQQLMDVFRLEDIPAIADMAKKFAEDIIANHSGKKLDAVQDLITLVPTRICRKYYGIPIEQDQEVEFGQWAIALSTFMFGDPTNDPKYRKVALAATQPLRVLLDHAIVAARQGQADPNTVVARLVAKQSTNPNLTDDIICAHLIGMITGFVPTNTMAAGHMLEALVGEGKFLWWNRRKFIGPAQEAIRQRDDDLLARCLFETLRFKPINFGPFRVATQDYTIAGGGFLGLWPKRIRAKSNIIASTQSAMFDGRRVERRYHFDPNRISSQYMLFGSGVHVCLGLFIAKAQITQTFRALLSQKNLRRVKGSKGKLTRLGPFPEHLFVKFD